MTEPALESQTEQKRVRNVSIVFSQSRRHDGVTPAMGGEIVRSERIERNLKSSSSCLPLAGSLCVSFTCHCSRPRNLESIAAQGEVTATLKASIGSTTMPHLLLHGPPGTGKTTTALAMVRELFGPELSKARVLELNASDERGIGVVRNKIKNFAAVAVGRPVEGHPSPPFKVVILDEADSMTKDAQNALRRTMETYSRVTRFIFICNYVSRIIEPLASRCAKFRFKSLQGDVMYDRIQYICVEEGVELADGSLGMLAKIAQGDMRKAITTLQSAFRLKGSPVEKETLLDVAGTVDDAVVVALLDACLKGEAFATVTGMVEEAVMAGYPCQELLIKLQEVLINDDRVPDGVKSRCLVRLATVDRCLSDGADEQLQLLSTLGYVSGACLKIS